MVCYQSASGGLGGMRCCNCGEKPQGKNADLKSVITTTRNDNNKSNYINNNSSRNNANNSSNNNNINNNINNDNKKY